MLPGLFNKNIVEQFTKSSEIGFSIESFMVEFSQFSKATAEISKMGEQ